MKTMKHLIFWPVLILFLLAGLPNIYAQAQQKDTLALKLQEKYPKMNAEALQQKAREKFEEWQRMRTEAESLAHKYKLPVRKKFKDGRVIELQRFMHGMPLYYTTFNLNAAETISTDAVWDPPYSLTGALVIAGIWDEGKVRTTHQEFNGSVTIKDDALNFSTHATHVAGNDCVGNSE